MKNLFSSVSKSATVSYLRSTSFLAEMFATVMNDNNDIMLISDGARIVINTPCIVWNKDNLHVVRYVLLLARKLSDLINLSYVCCKIPNKLKLKIYSKNPVEFSNYSNALENVHFLSLARSSLNCMICQSSVRAAVLLGAKMTLLVLRIFSGSAN